MPGENEAIGKSLERFASARNAADLADAGSVFLTTKGASLASDDDRFHAGLEKLVQIGCRASEEQLLALAFAWRVTALSPMRQNRIRLENRIAENGDLPVLYPQSLSDPDDRRYVGEALEAMGERVPVEYLAKAIVFERDAEKARVSYCDALLGKDAPLSVVVAAVTTAFPEATFEQKDSYLARARRFERVMGALSESAWNRVDELEVDAGLGLEMRALVESVTALNRSGNEEANGIIANASAGFVLVAIRLNGVLAAEAGTFEFAKRLERLFQPRGWPKDVRPAMAKLARPAAAQLVFLLRMKIKDKELRDAVTRLMGQVEAASYLQKRAKEADGLVEDEREWLKKGRSRKKLATQGAIEEAGISSIDESLAEAFLSASSGARSLASIRDYWEAEAGLLDENLKSRLDSLLKAADITASRVLSMAKSRGMHMFGEIGEVVDFNPVRHVPTEDAEGDRKVRVSVQGVERTLSGGGSWVVLKATVEKV